MLAVDTNIVVRFLVADDPLQSAQARDVLANNDVFVGATVLLETVWVLRKAYGFPIEAIARGLRGLAGLSQVTVEGAAALEQALAWSEQGMDFADAFHLARAGGSEGFLTFDARFVSTASRVAAEKRVRLPA